MGIRYTWLVPRNTSRVGVYPLRHFDGPDASPSAEIQDSRVVKVDGSTEQGASDGKPEDMVVLSDLSNACCVGKGHRPDPTGPAPGHRLAMNG
jgi:hypothetical protein